MADTNETEREYSELHDCPECGAGIALLDGIESAGDGTAFGYIECQADDCSFRGREEWVHDRTVAIEGGEN